MYVLAVCVCSSEDGLDPVLPTRSLIQLSRSLCLPLAAVTTGGNYYAWPRSQLEKRPSYSIGRCLPSMHKAFGSVSNTIIKQAWWLSPVILGKWDLEGQKFKVSF